MPRISEFYGIVVRMYYDEAHHPGRPRFHADYAGHAATVEIVTGSVLAGRLPSAQRRLVRRWAAAHRASSKRTGGGRARSSHWSRSRRLA